MWRTIKSFIESSRGTITTFSCTISQFRGSNDINIEVNFHLEEKSTNLQQKLHHAQEQILSLTAQKNEVVGKLKNLQDKMEDQNAADGQ